MTLFKLRAKKQHFLHELTSKECDHIFRVAQPLAFLAQGYFITLLVYQGWHKSENVQTKRACYGNLGIP